MSVQVEGGKGRGKSQNVDLNLVPFIDFMSCLIAFLMATAVWAEIAALEVEQNIAPPNQDIPPPVDPPPPPPLTIHIRADGEWIARKVEEGTNIPKLGEAYDYGKLEELLMADHELLPAEDLVIINTDDGVPYEEMMKVLDLTRKVGYPKTLLAGGPPSLVPDGVPAVAAPAPG